MENMQPSGPTINNNSTPNSIFPTPSNQNRQPVVRDANDNKTFKNVVFSFRFLLASALYFIFSFIFGMQTMIMYDASSYIFFFVIGLIIFIISFFTIWIIVKPKHPEIKYFSSNALFSLFLIGAVLNVLGAGSRWTYDYLAYKQANTKMEQDYEKWVPEISNNISFESEDLLANDSFQAATLFFKSVVGGNEKMYSYIDKDIKEVSSIGSGKPTISPDNNAVASVNGNIITVSNSELKKKFIITFNNFPDKSNTIGSDFSDDSNYYRAVVAFTKGQMMFGKRNVYLEKKLYVLFDLRKGDYQTSKIDNLPASKLKKKTVKPVDLSIDFDINRAEEGDCLLSVEPGYFPARDLSGYVVDKYYNTRSGGQKSITTYDPDYKYIYFVAIKKEDEQSAIFKMDKESCGLEMLLPKEGSIIDGLIHSVYFVDKNTMLYSVSPKNKDVLEIYSYDLISKNIEKKIEINNTEIFELIR